MNLKWVVALVALGVVLVAAATTGAYAYDSARSDVIPAGVTVAGVDVGGLTTEEARTRLEDEVVAEVRRPVVAVHGDRTFELSPDQVELQVDADGMVSEALAHGRDGDLFQRVFRDLRGRAVEEEVALRLDYSAEAAGAFARSIADELEVEPRDADVEPRPDGLDIVEGEAGRRVDAEELHQEIVSRLEAPGEPRTVDVPAETVAPEVTRDDLADRYPRYITVDRAATTLRLFQELEETHVYEIAVGQHGHDTPAGLYHIENMAENPAWHAPDRPWAGEFAGEVVPPDSPHNPIVSRWLGFHGGAGIHGTDDLGSIGERASRGCIRMTVPDVEELYELVTVGTPIYVG